MMKFYHVVIIPVLAIMLFCQACEKNPEQPVLFTMPPTEQPALGGTMRETAPLPETEAVPGFESVKPWLNYGALRKNKHPQTEHILTETSTIEEIVCRVGNIEQRFYEKKSVSEKNIQKISEIWSYFSGEELNPKLLTCIMKDKTMSFPSVPEQEYPDIQALEYDSDKILLHYDAEFQNLTVSRKDFPQNPDFVYTQRNPVWQFPVKLIYDEEKNKYDIQRDTDTLFAGYGDAVMLDGQEVTLIEMMNTAREFLYSYETESSLFFTSDYHLSDEGLEIRNFPDGRQAVIFRFGFVSRDMPVVSDACISSGNPVQSEGTWIEIGMFQKNQIGYVKANYFLNPPTQIQYTDINPKTEAVTLLDVNQAFQLADDFLTEERILESAKIQYATEKITDSRGIFQGYVLTPVWHMIFQPTEQELQENHYSMILDIDAVTNKIIQSYAAEPEQSGGQCWISHPGE